MTSDRILSLSTTHIIYAPLQKVYIADWLFNLADARAVRTHTSEQAQPRATMDVPMSINLETICDALMVQHYVAEVREPHSDAITAKGRTFDQYFFISYLRELKGKFHKLRATTEIKQEIVSITCGGYGHTINVLSKYFNFMKQDYIKYHHCIRY